MVTGTNGNTGTAIKQFAVGKASLSTATVSGISPHYVFTGAEIAPIPTVQVGERTLSPGIDYTVSYSDNLALGTATITITGQGGYEGTVSKTFSIVQLSLCVRLGLGNCSELPLHRREN